MSLLPAGFWILLYCLFSNLIFILCCVFVVVKGLKGKMGAGIIVVMVMRVLVVVIALAIVGMSAWGM